MLTSSPIRPVLRSPQSAKQQQGRSDAEAMKEFAASPDISQVGAQRG